MQSDATLLPRGAIYFEIFPSEDATITSPWPAVERPSPPWNRHQSGTRTVVLRHAANRCTVVSFGRETAHWLASRASTSALRLQIRHLARKLFKGGASGASLLIFPIRPSKCSPARASRLILAEGGMLVESELSMPHKDFCPRVISISLGMQKDGADEMLDDHAVESTSLPRRILRRIPNRTPPAMKAG